MKTQRIRWNDWNAVRCVAHDCELVVGVSAGPRILSLRLNSGPNLLYQDTTDFRVGEWRLHGGHRFTVGPESEESYYPDNAPCTVAMQGAELCVTAPVGMKGMQRVLGIRALADSAGFDIRHILRNHGTNTWRGLLWGITCVPNAGKLVVPVPENRLRFWPGADPAHWKVISGQLRLPSQGAPEKAGWHGDPAWVGTCQAGATLLISCPDPAPADQCIDHGCNVEVFTCEAYVELETLSGYTRLEPGDEATHLQRWQVQSGPRLAAEDVQGFDVRTACGVLPLTHES